MGKKIGLTYNLKSDMKLSSDDPADLNAEFDSEETVNFIASALESGGHRVKKIGHVFNLLKHIDDLDVDIVFNIAEGFNGRNRESQIPLLLELYGIPYVGADALTLGITLDKIAAKKCFIADGLPTAAYFCAESTKDLATLNTTGYPLIVKPRYEGTSKGLTDQSRVENLEQLTRQVDLITKKYKQAALVEKFIRGTEFTVPVLGNGHPQAMPVCQVKIDGKLNLGDDFFTFALVVAKDDRLQYICPAPIPKELAQTLKAMAIRAYKSVECRDFGSVEIRVDEHGHPYILEINPLPSLARQDVFNLFPQIIGSTYERVVNQILEFALQRYEFEKKQTSNHSRVHITSHAGR